MSNVRTTRNATEKYSRKLNMIVFIMHKSFRIYEIQHVISKLTAKNYYQKIFFDRLLQCHAKCYKTKFKNISIKS